MGVDMNFKSLVASFAVAALLPCVASAITFDFTDPDSRTGGSSNSNAQSFSYSSEGIGLEVSGVYFDQSGNRFDADSIGLYPGGLGVRSLPRPYDSHTVDNGGVFDFLLLEFDTQVSLDSISLGYRGGDTDVTLAYYSTPDIFHAGDIFNASLGSNPANPDGFLSDIWLIGAFSPIISDASANYTRAWDSFKVNGIGVSMSEVPLPGALWLFGTGLFVLGGLRRRAA